MRGTVAYKRKAVNLAVEACVQVFTVQFARTTKGERKMNDDTLSNKQMDCAVEVSEAVTQAVIAAQIRPVNVAGVNPELTKQQMLDRVAVLSDEIDANEEENRKMQEEITTLYASIDASN